MRLSRTHSTFSSIHLLSLVLAVVVGLAAFPQASRAQLDSEIPVLCSFLQESPATAGAKSAVTDTAATENSWNSWTRIVQSFNGDTLTELKIQELDADAGTWRDTARATPQYDSSDRLTLCTVENNQNGNFVNSIRQDLQYNGNGRLDSLRFETWDSSSGDWGNALLYTFEYDSNGNDTLQVNKLWNPDNQTWINSQRFHRMYDSQNRIDLERQESWDLFNQTWENAVRIQYTYSSDERVEVEQTWNGSSWANEERRTTSLNSSGLPTETLTENWDGSEWDSFARNTNTYMTVDNTQKLERTVSEDWDDTNGEWDNDSRVRFSYDSLIPVELARFEAQRIGGSEVRLTWQTASETNNSGFSIQRQAGPSAAWTNVGFVEGEGTTSEPQSYQFTDQAVPYQAETVRYRLKQVDLDGSTELSTVVEVRLGDPTRLALRAPFPNPSQNRATVRYELPEATEVQLAVYDLLGRRVATPVDGRKGAGRAQVQLRTQDLPSGTYILRLQAADQTRTQRLTVVK